MEKRFIYAYRPLSLDVVKYRIIKEDSEKYTLEDTTCQTHVNCVISISKDYKFLECINESSKIYSSYHENNSFHETENEAKEIACRSVILALNERITENEKYINKYVKVKEELESRVKTKIERNFDLRYGMKIYTFNERELRKITSEFYSKLENCLDLSQIERMVDEHKINLMIHSFITKNDKSSENKEYYVDLRERDRCEEMYFTIKVVKEEVTIERMMYDSEDSVEYCDGYDFHEGRAFKTKKQCLSNIYRGLLNEIEKKIGVYETNNEKYKKLIIEIEEKKISAKSE